MKFKVVPLMIGVLEATPVKLRYWLKEIGIESDHLQTAGIHQKVLKKPSGGLRKSVVTGAQEHESTIKIVCYIIR